MCAQQNKLYLSHFKYKLAMHDDQFIFSSSWFPGPKDFNYGLAGYTAPHPTPNSDGRCISLFERHLAQNPFGKGRLTSSKASTGMALERILVQSFKDRSSIAVISKSNPITGLDRP
jgi:hypothetical protein